MNKELKRNLRAAGWLTLCMVLVAATGCNRWGALGLGAAAVGGTAAGVAYSTADLEKEIDAKPRQIADATERAFKTLGIKLESKQATELEAKIVGKYSNDDGMGTDPTATVRAKLDDDGKSDVFIRVKTFGDDEEQREIYNEIMKELGQ